MQEVRMALTYKYAPNEKSLAIGAYSCKKRVVLFLGASNFIHMNRLRKYLRELREQKNLKQEEDAELLSVSPSTYSRWERGEKELCAGEIERVSRVLCGDELALYAFLASPLMKLSPITTVTVSIYTEEAYRDLLVYLSSCNPKSINIIQSSEKWK